MPPLPGATLRFISGRTLKKDFTTTPFTYKTKQGTKEQDNLPQGEEIQFGLNFTESSPGIWSWPLGVGSWGGRRGVCSVRDNANILLPSPIPYSHETT